MTSIDWKGVILKIYVDYCMLFAGGSRCRLWSLLEIILKQISFRLYQRCHHVQTNSTFLNNLEGDFTINFGSPCFTRICWMVSQSIKHILIQLDVTIYWILTFWNITIYWIQLPSNVFLWHDSVIGIRHSKSCVWENTFPIDSMFGSTRFAYCGGHSYYQNRPRLAIRIVPGTLQEMNWNEGNWKGNRLFGMVVPSLKLLHGHPKAVLGELVG